MSKRMLSPETDKQLQQYFTTLAPNYSSATGNTTRTLLDDILGDVKLGITGNALIHDNGCGHGTATAAVLDFCASRAISPPKITATDCNEAMIEALKKRQTEKGAAWSTVEAKVMSSTRQVYHRDDTFHFSFCNISVQSFAEPIKALYEIHRTLRPAGIAVITTWKRFGVGEVARNAQRKVKGGESDSEVKPPGAEMMKEGILANLMYITGWELGKIKTMQKDVLVKEGTTEFSNMKNALLTGSEFEWMRAGWTDEENQKWPQALEEALKEEVAEHGGLLMEAWVCLGRKWDALYA